MSAPHFFGTASVFCPQHYHHPEKGGEGYVFCETTDQGQGDEPDRTTRYYVPERRIRCKTEQDLIDLKHAVEYALAIQRNDWQELTPASQYRTQ